MIFRKILPVTCFLASWLFLLSCGSIGEPLPPRLNIPNRAENLRAQQTSDGVVLSWTPPLRTTEASPIREMLRYTIYALTLEQPEEFISPSRFKNQSQEVLTIEEGQAYKIGEESRIGITLEISQQKTGSFAYSIRTENKKRRSVGFSEPVIIEIVETPAELDRPTLATSASGITVQWQDAERASSYQIFRKSSIINNLEKIGEVNNTIFIDEDFSWGIHYFYYIRGLRRTLTGFADGPLSPPAEIITKDVYPPSPPRQLTAVPSGPGVELVWQQNTDPDLAGYRIYRQVGEIETSLNNDGLIATPRFSDLDVVHGDTYSYTVTAVDHRGNESAVSNKVQTSVP